MILPVTRAKVPYCLKFRVTVMQGKVLKGAAQRGMKRGNGRKVGRDNEETTTRARVVAVGEGGGLARLLRGANR